MPIDNFIMDSICCPITTQIFRNPVNTADGHTYERQAIQEWLNNHNTSPNTNEKLPNRQLVPHFFMRQMIQQLLDDKKISESELYKEDINVRNREDTPSQSKPLSF